MSYSEGMNKLKLIIDACLVDFNKDIKTMINDNQEINAKILAELHKLDTRLTRIEKNVERETTNDKKVAGEITEIKISLESIADKFKTYTVNTEGLVAGLPKNVRMRQTELPKNMFDQNLDIDIDFD